jgi:hypothetical protein
MPRLAPVISTVCFSNRFIYKYSLGELALITPNAKSHKRDTPDWPDRARDWGWETQPGRDPLFEAAPDREQNPVRCRINMQQRINITAVYLA